MTYSSFIKSPIFIGGASAAGIGGMGAVGGAAHEASKPTAKQLLEKDGLKFQSLDPSGLGVFTGKDSETFQYTDKPTTTPSACFKNFFPGAGNISLTVTDTDTSNRNKERQKGTNTYDSKTQGCALAQLAFRYGNSSGTRVLTDFDFKLEMIFKDEKYGWAFWVLGNGSENSAQGSPSWKKTLHYYVAFLEKGDSLDSGTIKGGYQWADKHGSDDKTRNVKIEFLEEKWLNNIEGQQSKIKDNKGHTKEFTGRGEEAAGGKEIFSGMDIQSPKYEGGKLEDQCEVFCKNFQEFKTRSGAGLIGSNFSPGFNDQTSHLFEDGDTGKAGKPYKNVYFTAGMDDGIEPFRDKKGKGTHLEENFCNRVSNSKNFTPDELQKLKTYCYTNPK